MLSVCRTDCFIRILVVTTMVWGFALPIAHLVCGMTVDSEAILCDAHALTDGTLHADGHEARAHTGMQTAGHEAPAHNAPVAHDVHATHASPARNMLHTQTAMQAVRHEAARHGSHDPCPTPEFNAGDARVECCWVDANALERRAPLPSLTQLPDLTGASTGVAPTVDLREVRVVSRTADAPSFPPVAFRLLFSVFLI